MKKHIHTVTRGGRDYTLRVTDYGDELYILAADLDPDVDPDRPVLRVSGTISAIVKAFADWQFRVPGLTEDPLVSFDFEGQSICNPWYDSTGRFEQSAVAAVKKYGPMNVALFIANAVIYMFDMKEVETHD